MNCYLLHPGSQGSELFFGVQPRIMPTRSTDNQTWQSKTTPFLDDPGRLVSYSLYWMLWFSVLDWPHPLMISWWIKGKPTHAWDPESSPLHQLAWWVSPSRWVYNNGKITTGDDLTTKQLHGDLHHIMIPINQDNLGFMETRTPNKNPRFAPSPSHQTKCNLCVVWVVKSTMFKDTQIIIPPKETLKSI